MIHFNYMFFYYRTSPRGNSKFGIAECPWNRIRHVQQGTDEPVTFDRLWLTRSTGFPAAKRVESQLKKLYADRCLTLQTRRAGHTEWFTALNYAEWLENFLARAAEQEMDVVAYSQPYSATRRRDCPFNLPESLRFNDPCYQRLWTQLAETDCSAETVIQLQDRDSRVFARGLFELEDAEFSLR